MSQSLPKTTKQWNVVDEGGLASLRFSEQPVPDLGDNEVLVKCELALDPNLDNC